MIGESIAILAVILVMAGMSVRAGKRRLARLSLPFVSIPAVFLIGEGLLYTLRPVASLPVAALRLSWILIGALAGVSFCLLASRLFQERRSRMGYLVFGWVFLVALAFAYYLQIV